MAEGRKHPRIVSFLLPLLVVALVWAAMYSLKLLPGQKESTGPLLVSVGHDYYVTVSLVELSEKDAADERWDAIRDRLARAAVGAAADSGRYSSLGTGVLP